MRFIQLCVLTLSRFFVSAAFLAGAVKNFISWHETEKNLISALSDWQAHFGVSTEIQVLFSILISWSSALLIFASAILLLGGLLVLLGVKEKLGIAMLIFFLIPATVLYHPFWWVEGVAHELQTILFLKNLAILGCLTQLLLQRSPKQMLGFDERPTSMRF